MKYLIFLALLCGCQYVTGIKEGSKPELTYNPQKDSLVNGLLNTNPVKVEKWDVEGHYYCHLYYPDYKITIAYYQAKKFENKEEWHYIMDDKDGENILLETVSGLAENSLNGPTYERLKTLVKP